MPTYMNKTGMQINYEAGGKIYSFPAGRETGTTICVPYKELGLELMDENSPPLKSRVLAGGTFLFKTGMERKVQIKHCGKYRLQVTARKGRVKLYLGSSGFGIDVSGEHDSVQEWGCAPYVRILGLNDGTEASLYCEAIDE